MPQARCPSCGASLRLADAVPGSSVTCPRCLAEVPNPNAAATGITASPPAAPPAPESPATVVPAATCAECGEAIDTRWRVCPYCGADRPTDTSVPRRRRLVTAEVDVRRDTTTIGVGMILLAVLGGLGVFWLVMGAFSSGDVSLIGSVVVGLLFVALVAAGIGWLRTRSNPAAFGVGRVVVGTLALAGGLLISGVLLGIAGFVFLFVACLMGGRF